MLKDDHVRLRHMLGAREAVELIRRKSRLDLDTQPGF